MALETDLATLTPRRPFPARLGPRGNLVYKLVTTTYHKLIGIMYVVTCFVFFFVGGLLVVIQLVMVFTVLGPM